MQILLHIGSHKTGSTAIQRFCWRNHEALLRKRVLYPTAYLVNGAQHALAWSLGVNHPKRDATVTPEQIAQGILEEGRRSGAEWVIVSSEDFETLGEEAVKKLRGLFQDVPVRVLLYLRRQDEALVAGYNQRVKWFGSRLQGTLEELSRQPFISHRYNYWRLIERWANIFGADAMRVRVYDPAQFPDGNIIPDFFSSINVTVNDMEIDRQANVNQSVHPLALEIIRRSNNKEMTRTVHNVMLQLLNKAASERPTEHMKLTGPAHRDFVAQFAESNARVARKWLGKEDGILFPQMQPDASNPAPGGARDELLVDVLIDALIAATGGLAASEPEKPGRILSRIFKRRKNKTAAGRKLSRREKTKRAAKS